MTDRLPPHSIEFEQGILGCILLNPRELWEFIATYPDCERYFYDLRHADIYRAILDLAQSRKPVDLITVQENLKVKDRLDSVGGIAYLSALPEAPPSAANMSYYADELKVFFQRREIIRIGTEAALKAFEGRNDALEFAEREILSIGRNSSVESEMTMKDLACRVIEMMDEAYKNRGKLVGVPTGFATVDRMTRGLKPGQMFVIGGRPGNGKTALGLNIVDHAAIDRGIPTGVISLEMTKEELMKRLLCARARVPSDDLESANLSVMEQEAIKTELAKISRAPIHIQDPAGIYRSSTRRSCPAHGPPARYQAFVGGLPSTPARAQPTEPNAGND